MGVHEAASKGFGRGADDYERSRPGYPRPVIDRLAAELPIRPRSRVCDLAAGTGKLTRLLLDTGADVVAVEPVPAMRRKLTVICPDALVVDGTAQSIPLDDGSVDVVTIAQAFHWFATTEALDEIARVLKPGGGLAMLWNIQDESVAWVAEVERLVLDHGGDRPYPTDRAPDRVVAACGRFTPMANLSVPHPVSVTPELVVSRVASTSFVAALPDDRRQACLDAVAELLRTHPDTGGHARFDHPYLTTAYWCHLA